MAKPNVFIAVVISNGRDFDLGSLTANLGAVAGPGSYSSPLRVSVPDANVASRMLIRAKLRPLSGPVNVALLGWSSALDDDVATPGDERWQVVARKAAKANEVVELLGTFKPYGDGA